MTLEMLDNMNFDKAFYRVVALVRALFMITIWMNLLFLRKCSSIVR